MGSSYVVRCPMCGHETPRTSGREFIVCTCGLRVACGAPPATGGGRTETVFATLALFALVGAAFDLLRRFL